MLRNFCFLLLLKKTILTLGEDKDDLNKDIEKIFIERRVIPDVLSEPPESILKISYPRIVIDKPGKMVNYAQVKTEPNISWPNPNPDPDAFYLLYMINPDVQDKNSSTKSEWLHWAVININGEKLGGASVKITGHEVNKSGRSMAAYSAANAGDSTG